MTSMATLCLLPEYMLEGWTPTLPARIDPAEVITLVLRAMPRMSSFHSELQDATWIWSVCPAGKFDTNYLGVPIGGRCDEICCA